MTTKTRKIYVSNLVINAVKKDIQNIHLGVYPPNGRIRVAAPLNTSDEVIRLFILSKMPWIREQQLKFLQQERQSQREYVAGESHYVFGRRYRLNIIYTEDKPRIEIKRKTHIALHIRPDTPTIQREKIFDKFYRAELSKLIPSLLERWKKKLNVQVDEVRIKKMKTKWGSCNPKDKRIWLNLELAKKSIQCINYTFVHELIHLIEKNHTERFIQIFQSTLPRWELHKDELNRQPLGYSHWKYQA